MRAVSLRSLKSDTRSEGRSGVINRYHGVQQMEFDDFIEQSCKKFECPVSVAVGKEIQRETTSLKSSKLKYKRKSTISQLADIPSPRFHLEAGQLVDDHTLQVYAYYDVFDDLVEIQMKKYHYQPVPRVLMQLIALKVPYTRHLTKFTIKQCYINMYTLYELNKILTITNITDVCLDHSPLKEGNFDILLSEQTKLRSLSLCRCKINDAVCERIAARLHYNEPAEQTLFTLNLATNDITDLGCKHFGEALRSNRHLRYLNLSDNHITDDGARFIFTVLTEFQLTEEETIDKGKRYLRYLKKMQSLYDKCLDQYGKSDDILGTKKTGKKGTSLKSRPIMKRERIRESHSQIKPDDLLKKRAQAMSLEMLGPFQDPFGETTVILKNELWYSIGNLSLCYLNFAYNHLSFISLQKLLAVVTHQKKYRTEKMCGLVHVVLDGNRMPTSCDEYILLTKELHRSRTKKSGHHS